MKYGTLSLFSVSLCYSRKDKNINNNANDNLDNTTTTMFCTLTMDLLSVLYA